MNFEKEKLRKFTTAYKKEKKSRNKFNQECEISINWKIQQDTNENVKENINKLKDIPGSWAGRIKTVKTATLLCTTDLMQLVSKLQWQFQRNRKNNPKIQMESQRSQIVKAILRKIRTRSIMFPVKLHYETKAIKTF